MFGKTGAWNQLPLYWDAVRNKLGQALGVAFKAEPDFASPS